ncbi:MAG: NAD(P)H-dependent oxidoreductase [Saprospiraceae bacterium]|jgi:NAD(P)H-dependent FMN reductase|nr:NAD(P)H-dependent oxidoreductase [Saprospiraceae bacterium]MBL0025020.1 NAD(P)H-dependent oxidoreductase [Saprospiraceae bacterium]
MITIISGTNRPKSRTLAIAEWCQKKLENSGVESQLLELTKINIPLLSASMYERDHQHPYISALQEKYLIQSDHWLIVSPEYNGSFPGVLKLFIDAVSVKQYKETFSTKKASLIGVASGRAGNFRGMEHLTGILNYLNVVVMPNRLPVSSVDKVLDLNGQPDKITLDALNSFIDEMLVFNSPFNFIHRANLSISL